MFTHSLSRVLSIIAILLLTLSSCSDIGDLEDFDPSKLKESYQLEFDYSRESLSVDEDSVSGEQVIDAFIILALHSNDHRLNFEENAMGHYHSYNKYNYKNMLDNYFNFKIEQDSLIYLRTMDESGNNLGKFAKVGVLIEYGKEYDYFIFRVLDETYKNLECKAVVYDPFAS